MKAAKKQEIEALNANLTQAREERASFLAKSEALISARPEIIRAGGGDAELDDNDAAQRAARLGAQRAKEKIAVIEEELSRVAADAASLAQKRIEEKADLAAQAAANELHRLWRRMVPEIRSALRAAALADQLIEDANRGRGAGEALAGVEARVRVRPARPMKVLSEERVWLWTYLETGAIIASEETIAKIEDRGPNKGRIELRSDRGFTDVVRRKFLRRTFLAAACEELPRPLSHTLNIPGLRAGDAPGWCAPPDSNIAAWADALENRDAIADDRQSVVELVPLDRQADGAA